MGGTFTDCVLTTNEGRIHVGKVETRPEDLLRTTSEALDLLSDQVGLDASGLLAETEQFVLGTTLTTNLLVTQSGHSVGLITTRGHRDVLHIAGGAQGKIAGLSDDDIRHSGRLNKPTALAPKDLIFEVDERVDYKGSVLTPLNEEQVREAAIKLRDLGVRAIAIGFLWSFSKPEHELRAAEIVKEVAPEIDTTCSHALVSRIGEYLRFSSAAINAYCAPVLREYLERQTSWLHERGLKAEPLIMQAQGGVVPASIAADTSIYTVGSGPVAGVVGAASLGEDSEGRNVICTDMGGTTFDVGLVHSGEPVTANSGVAHRYPFYGQIVDVSSIGSGGGSIAWVDQASGVLKVGPQSAGANPGPACYGRGGDRPTVTDANVVLGFLNPERFLGGSMALDAEAARRVIEHDIAKPLNLTVEEAALAIYRITNGHMADFLRRKTIENGYDPRSFDLYAYGGAGPLHATSFARELGVGRVVIPLGNTASVYSALGVLTSDIRHIFERTTPMFAPFDSAVLGAAFVELEDDAKTQLEADGVAAKAQVLKYSVDMRYGGQIFDVEVQLDQPITSDEQASAVLDSFDTRYDEMFGEGAGFREAGVELLMCRVVGIGLNEPINPKAAAEGASSDPQPDSRRPVYFEDGAAEAAAYDGGAIAPGAELAGPAIIELPHTSVVLHPGDRGRWNDDGTIDIEVGGVSGNGAPGGLLTETEEVAR